jgi:hypothetical protein
MIYIILIISALCVPAAFLAGAYVYRQGVDDGMRRINGAVDLPPLFEKRKSEPDNEYTRLQDIIENYHGISNKGVSK